MTPIAKLDQEREELIEKLRKEIFQITDKHLKQMSYMQEAYEEETEDREKEFKDVTSGILNIIQERYGRRAREEIELEIKCKMAR